MKNKIYVSAFFLASFSWIIFSPDLALATQRHGGIEGVYIHQLSHLFFAVSMGILIYWLRQRNLVKETGWRFIQYAALFFILWNLDAFIVHLLDDQLNIIHVKKIDMWHVRINAENGQRGLEILYYIAKLDHLFCVPALFFLYAGLRRLLKETKMDFSRNEQP